MDSGTVHPIIRGNAFVLAQRKSEAVLTEPKRGTGRGWIVRVRMDWNIIVLLIVVLIGARKK
jgi:hypothetical protein